MKGQDNYENRIMEINKTFLFFLFPLILVVFFVVFIHFGNTQIDVREPAKLADRQYDNKRVVSKLINNYRQQDKNIKQNPDEQLSLSIKSELTDMKIHRTFSTDKQNGSYIRKLQQLTKLETKSIDKLLSVLPELLRDDNPQLRLAAVESAGNIRHSDLSLALQPALHDMSPLVRTEALNALSAQDDPAIVSTIDPLLFDKNRQVRLAAINALSEIGSEESIVALASLLTDGDIMIRLHAVSALGEIGGIRSIAYLLHARNDSDNSIQSSVESILDELENAY